MAKEKFIRDKPHVNIGAVSQILEDTAGQLTLAGSGSEALGNLPPSTILEFGAPQASVPQVATVGYPFDTEFLFNPAIHGAAESIDFSVDVLPLMVDGASQFHVTLALWQDEYFVATLSQQAVGEGAAWVTLGDVGLIASDFSAVDHGSELPDFGRPFQFGYAFSGEYSIGGLDVQIGVDNMVVEITTIPEPSSIVLVLTLGAVLLWNRFWPSGWSPSLFK